MRSSTWSKSVKTAALAPMPRASVMTTVSVKPGERLNWRSAYRTSLMSGFIGNSPSTVRLFGAQSLHRFDGSRAAGGQKAGKRRTESEDQRGARQRQRIVFAHPKELAG